MRYLAILGVIFAIGQTACDSGQETPQSTPPETSRQATPEAPATTQDPAEEGEAPELVEESAAVVDDSQPENQPILLAEDSVAPPAGDWKFKEGEHFQRLVPTQPTVGGADKVEVAEIFWYGCNHCFDFEPYINRWAEDAPANVRFVRIPAMWNPLVKLHGQLYYTEEVLVKNDTIEDPEAFHAAVFNEYHRRGNRLTSEAAIEDLFERLGVSAEDFQATWKSFEVAQKMRVAEDLARRYAITGVPAVVVNGKYRTGGAEAGGYPALLEVIDELVARETAR
ncbi:MAG: thiol:disulfide interchange protein DsbA/DsbL [Woeseiaceae bacterium]